MYSTANDLTVCNRSPRDVQFGVDEAGKGPALGSMFAAAVSLKDPNHLPDGIADSKRLAPARREELAATLRADDRIRVGVAEITPATIDDPETNMNALAVSARDGDRGRARELDDREPDDAAAPTDPIEGCVTPATPTPTGSPDGWPRRVRPRSTARSRSTPVTVPTTIRRSWGGERDRESRTRRPRRCHRRGTARSAAAIRATRRPASSSSRT